MNEFTTKIKLCVYSTTVKKINGHKELIRNSLDDIAAGLVTMPNNLAILGIERE